MSLRFKLTLLYPLIFGGTLLLFGVLVYGIVSVILVNQIDQTLAQESMQLLEKMRVSPSNRLEQRSLIDFQPTNSNLVYQIWANDRTLEFARPMAWKEALDPGARFSGAPFFQYRTSNNVHMRVLTIPIQTKRGPAGAVQVGMSLNLLDVTQRALSTVLVTLASFSILLATIVSWLVTGRAFAPLSTMTQTATQISRTEDLSRRLPLTSTPDDEMGQLVQAFNALLTRMENLFNTQRRFVADVSHELRTPLTVIKGEVGLMRKMSNADEESLHNIETEVDRLTRLVGDLLLLAQAESGKLPLQLQVVELDSVLLDVFQQMRVLGGDRIQLKIAAIDQVLIEGDRDRIKQVMLNLVGNAVQYTPAGGTVTLSLDKTREFGRFFVTDTGPGIPPEDLPNIFERFYRGQRSRTRSSSSSSGFGLGLSIANWIVKAHKGKIEVVSKEGQGATFCVWLPLLPENSPLPAEPHLRK